MLQYQNFIISDPIDNPAPVPTKYNLAIHEPDDSQPADLQ